MKTCAVCGNELEEWEAESPLTDEDGDPVCYDCYDDHYTFTCSRCENMEHISKRGAIGGLFVATDEESLGIPDGIYEVTEHPFYADGMIEMYLFKNAVRYVCPNATRISTDPYPMGFLCEKCGGEIRAAASEEVNEVAAA